MNKKGLLIFIAASLLSTGLFAANTPIIKDNANLLTDEQEKILYEDMLPVAEYGGVMLYTNEEEYSEYSASDLAKRLCKEAFEGESGIVFLIDMYERRIEIYSTGHIYSVLGKMWANSICDNIYTYATKEDYYTCSKLCFEQMATLLKGGKISVPMRRVSRILFALAFAFFFNFLFTYTSRIGSSFGKRTPLVEGSGNLKEPAAKKAYYSVVHKRCTKVRKTAHSSGSSGGSSGGGGFSGGGGGGGGGGHGF